jgi:hypothetical protein
MKAKRVGSFKERMAIKDQQVEIGQHYTYTCGCGGFLWILTTEGDCVCGQCMRAQARITVKELAPVRRLAPNGLEKDRG